LTISAQFNQDQRRCSHWNNTPGSIITGLKPKIRLKIMSKVIPSTRFFAQTSAKFYAALFLALASMASNTAFANSFGSPVCEVNSLPLMPMANSVSNPVPTGWSLRTDKPYFQSGAPLEIRIGNIDPLKRVRGVLLWAKTAADLQPAGSFLVGPGSMWQFIPPGPGAFCQQASVTHMDSAPKEQSTLVFSWTPPTNDSDVLLRAFLIEDCALVTGCRGAQALTPALILSEAVFKDRFEDQ
jgi:Reeler domain